MARILILGAGPCGLGAAVKLQRCGERDFTVLEAGELPGGLARSFVDEQGFTWDIGGHVQFSHYEDFDDLMDEVLPNEWLTHQRESWVRMENRWIPYPFQYNLHRLSPESQQRCLEGLERLEVKSRADSRPQNFGEWIDQSFGDGISKIFMRPYNFKVWAHPPELMSYQWIGERVAQVQIERVRENIRLQKDDVSWGPNATFRFPKQGGTGEIWKRVGRLVGNRLRLKTRVTRIDLRAKRVTLEASDQIEFDYLLNTLPLDVFARLAHFELAGELLFSRSHIVGLGLEGPQPEELRTKCWMYFPESNSPYYRATVFSNYSPAHVPNPSKHWSLMCETAESSYKKVSTQTLIADTERALREDGLILPETRVVSRWHFVAPHGYPIPSLNRDQIVHDALHRLEAYSVYSRGRFGLWKYEVSNQDHSFMQGYEWASGLIEGTEQWTYRDPARVNAPGKRPRLPQIW
jgi:protoporphyrinogen oxidase